VPHVHSFNDIFNLFRMMKYKEKFESFEKFQIAFKEWCDTNYHPWRIDDSKYTDKSKLAYKYFRYECVLSGDPEKIVSKGDGKRPKQDYNHKKCEWSIRINFQKKTKFMSLLILMINTIMM
jgi:hypothetical protein